MNATRVEQTKVTLVCGECQTPLGKAYVRGEITWLRCNDCIRDWIHAQRMAESRKQQQEQDHPT